MRPRPRKHCPVPPRHGYKPPEWLLRKMRRRHPTVSLMWEPNLHTYALVQTDIPGKPHLIRVLEERPNIDNTVRFLDAHHPSHLSNRFKIDRFLGKVDAAGPGEGDFSDRVAEGSDRLWHALNPRLVVPRTMSRQQRRRLLRSKR